VAVRIRQGWWRVHEKLVNCTSRCTRLYMYTRCSGPCTALALSGLVLAAGPSGLCTHGRTNNTKYRGDLILTQPKKRRAARAPRAYRIRLSRYMYRQLLSCPAPPLSCPPPPRAGLYAPRPLEPPSKARPSPRGLVGHDAVDYDGPVQMNYELRNELHAQLIDQFVKVATLSNAAPKFSRWFLRSESLTACQSSRPWQVLTVYNRRAVRAARP